MEAVEIAVESLAFGGDAVGRLAGKVVFVPFAAPGDRAEVRLVDERRSFSRAELVTVRRPGPDRRAPACPLFGRCGGCQWQHVGYPAQLAAKHRILADALRRVLPDLAAELPLPEGGEELGYRRRVRMTWRTGRGAATVGFFQRRSKEPLDVARCPLLTPALQRALEVCRRCLAGIERAGAGTVALLANPAGEAHVSFHVERGPLFDPSPLLAAPIVGGRLVRRADGRGRRGARARRRGEEIVRFGVEAIDLAVDHSPALFASSAAFAQVNAAEDLRLGQRVARWAAASGLRVLELHAGIGNFTRLLAPEAAAVRAVELSSEACALLRRNVADLGPVVRVDERDAGVALAALASRQERYDVVLLDPPRQGAAGIARHLAAVGARRVVYVSCDPMTLARDLVELVEAGFEPTRVRVHDMMPQTFHLETVVLLEARRGEHR